MVAWIISGVLLILVIYFGIRLHQKIIIDKTELSEYQSSIDKLKAQKNDLNEDIRTQQDIIESNNNRIKSTKDEINQVEVQYSQTMRDRTQELDAYFEDLRASRQQELDEYAKKAKADNEQLVQLQYADLINRYESYQNEAHERAECAIRASTEIIDEAYDRATKAIEGAKEEEARFNAILEPLRQYEKEKQERLFYTIQVPDEYKDDIEFLLTTVAAKVAHPDIINKLVWAEYVKPYLDDTFKRVGIEDKPGIYKLTSLIDGKCYVGKSTNMKKRISDHMRSTVGISAIADQAVHHAMAREGYWNWTIEPIIYCEKDKLNELEKYYIKFFKGQEWGYNKTGGNEG